MILGSYVAFPNAVVVVEAKRSEAEYCRVRA
jgi:hypothetical protein